MSDVVCLQALRVGKDAKKYAYLFVPPSDVEAAVKVFLFMAWDDHESTYSYMSGESALDTSYVYMFVHGGVPYLGPGTPAGTPAGHTACTAYCVSCVRVRVVCSRACMRTDNKLLVQGPRGGAARAAARAGLPQVCDTCSSTPIAARLRMATSEVYIAKHQ